MLLLTLFAFVAGAGTAISPCVLPVLPALLSAGATGGHRRPLGIVLGHAVTFTVTIVGLSEVVDGVGLGDGITRTLAIAALLGFGLAVLVPAVGDRLEAPLSRLARFGPSGRGGDGFWSGVAIGGALGFVYAPCAGPILAAVIAVSAASGETVLIGLGYAAGSSVVLLGLALGGRRVVDRIRAAGRGPAIQRVIGIVMVATAMAMAADLDVRFQTAIAQHLPDAVVNPTKPLEDAGAVEDRLRELRGAPRFDSDAASAARPARRETASGGPGLPGVETPDLPVLGRAPEFTGTQRWFNTPGDRPLSLAALTRQRKVVLVDFWTYTCINCIRTFPYLKAWHERYADQGLTIVGVHTPEFAFEKDAGNVREAIDQSDLRHPVAQDNDYATWNAWGNQYWPAKYLVDAEGRVRYTHFGEGDYEETEAAIRALLAEAGDDDLGAAARARDDLDPERDVTPETYLGSLRAARVEPGGSLREGTRTYRPATDLPADSFTLGGRWRVEEERSTAVRGATIRGRVRAKDVYLVLSAPEGRPGEVRVSLDGRPVAPADAGAAVRRDGRVRVGAQTIYHLVSLDAPAERELGLELSPGVSGYAFTFG